MHHIAIKFCKIIAITYELNNKVFPSIAQNYRNHQWLSVRTILTVYNKQCHNKINISIQNRISGDMSMSSTYKSIDSYESIKSGKLSYRIFNFNWFVSLKINYFKPFCNHLDFIFIPLYENYCGNIHLSQKPQKLLSHIFIYYIRFSLCFCYG